jgi:hypothetical protein
MQRARSRVTFIKNESEYNTWWQNEEQNFGLYNGINVGFMDNDLCMVARVGCRRTINEPENGCFWTSSFH